MIFFTAFLFQHLDKAMLMKLFPEILELLSIVQKTAKFVKETLWSLEFQKSETLEKPNLRLFYIFNSFFIFKYLPKTSCITNRHPVSLFHFMNIVPAQHWIFMSLIIVITVVTHNSANAEQTL